MVGPKDFVALGVWLALVLGYRAAAARGLFELDLNKQDRAFVAVVLLVTFELIWLRVGYPAP